MCSASSSVVAEVEDLTSILEEEGLVSNFNKTATNNSNNNLVGLQARM